MLLLDTNAQKRWRKGGVVERTRHLTRSAFADELERNAVALTPDNGRPVTEPEAQLGEVMSIASLISKVRQCNPGLIYERSNNYPEKGGFYAMKPDPNEPWSPNKRLKVMVASTRHGWIPEFTVRLVKKETRPDIHQAGNFVTLDVPAGVEMGWRTTIARLYRQGYLSADDIQQHFPRMLRDSMYWHHAMKKEIAQ